MWNLAVEIAVTVSLVALVVSLALDTLAAITERRNALRDQGHKD